MKSSHDQSIWSFTKTIPGAYGRDNGEKKRLVAVDHFIGDCSCMGKMTLHNDICYHKLEIHFTLEQLLILVIVGSS